MKILLAEPSKTIQLMVSSLLQELPVEIVSVETAAQVLSAGQLNSYDLLCLSRHLADMTGLELAQRLAADSASRHTPVVMLASEADERLRDEAITAGVSEVFSLTALEQLHHYLESAAQQSQQHRTLDGRVLLVEDSATMAAILVAALQDSGLVVDHFTNAEAALAEFGRHDYDLVLTDVNLEGAMSGIALTRAVRGSQGGRARTPVLAISGLDNAAHKIELLRSGANDYISKPIVREELAARVYNLILNKQLLDKIERQNEEMRAMAMTDQLTSLYNRHFLQEAASNAVKSAYRYRRPLSLLVVDLDHFKSINDTHGHSVGDQVLVAAAAMLRSFCRDSDIPARFGGEEFVLLLPECGETDAAQVAERIRQSIAELRPNGIEISASFGVASLPLEQKGTFDTMFEEADQAVYKAKKDGRNRVVVASSLNLSAEPAAATA